VVDEIDEGHFDRISFVEINQVSAMRLKSQESADRAGENAGESCVTHGTEIGYRFRGVAH
jgi:hypothetical protein